MLNTDCAMSKMLDFIRDVNDFEKLKNADIGLRNVGIDGDSVTSISKIESNGGTASGKRKARSIHPIDSGRDLWNMLRQNRNSYPALCVLHRAIDSYYRYSCCYKFANVPTEEFAQGEREAHIEIVLALLQTVKGVYFFLRLSVAKIFLLK